MLSPLVYLFDLVVLHPKKNVTKFYFLTLGFSIISPYPYYIIFISLLLFQAGFFFLIVARIGGIPINGLIKIGLLYDILTLGAYIYLICNILQKLLIS